MDIEKNKRFYRHCIGKAYKYKEKILELNDHAIIYRFKSEYFCLDSELKRVTYYLKYKVDNNGTLGQYVWQSLVWVDPTIQDRYLTGIPKQIFFDYLLPKFHTIITDSEQTFYGKRFWQQSIAMAFDKNLNVYFFDFAGRILKKLQSIDELADFQNTYDIWGPAKKHEMKRMVITDKELTEK